MKEQQLDWQAVLPEIRTYKVKLSVNLEGMRWTAIKEYLELLQTLSGATFIKVVIDENSMIVQSYINTCHTLQELKQKPVKAIHEIYQRNYKTYTPEPPVFTVRRNEVFVAREIPCLGENLRRIVGKDSSRLRHIAGLTACRLSPSGLGDRILCRGPRLGVDLAERMIQTIEQYEEKSIKGIDLARFGSIQLLGDPSPHVSLLQQTLFLITTYCSQPYHLTLLYHCITSIRHQYPTVRIIVVDDYSPLDVTAHLHKHFKKDQHLSLEKTLQRQAGELNAYLWAWLHQYEYYKIVYLHDSVRLRRKIDRYIDTPQQFHGLWYADATMADYDTICKENKELLWNVQLKTHRSSSSWASLNTVFEQLLQRNRLEVLFGCMAIFGSGFVHTLFTCTNLYEMAHLFRTRVNRSCLERILDVVAQMHDLVHPEHIAGDIMDHPHAFQECAGVPSPDDDGEDEEDEDEEEDTQEGSGDESSHSTSPSAASISNSSDEEASPREKTREKRLKMTTRMTVKKTSSSRGGGNSWSIKMVGETKEGDDSSEVGGGGNIVARLRLKHEGGGKPYTSPFEKRWVGR